MRMHNVWGTRGWHFLVETCVCVCVCPCMCRCVRRTAYGVRRSQCMCPCVVRVPMHVPLRTSYVCQCMCRQCRRRHRRRRRHHKGRASSCRGRRASSDACSVCRLARISSSSASAHVPPPLQATPVIHVNSRWSTPVTCHPRDMSTPVTRHPRYTSAPIIKFKYIKYIIYEHKAAMQPYYQMLLECYVIVRAFLRRV